MKNKILDKLVTFVNNGNYSKNDLEKIRYGFECIYILITKGIIIFTIAYFLGILKYTLIFSFFFGLIRIFAGGLHATSSIACLITSALLFIIFPYLSKIIIINNIVRLVTLIIATVLILIYAPADTKKRPIVSPKKRLRLKITSIIISLSFIISSFFITKNYVLNSMTFGMILEAILILPITYKIFKLPYNNYINYLNSHKMKGGL